MKNFLKLLNPSLNYSELNEVHILKKMIGNCVGKNCFNHRAKHEGGNVMIWGRFRIRKVHVKLVLVKSKMDKKMYYGILIDHAIPSDTRNIGRGFHVEHYNDPKPTSKLR